MCLGIKIGPFPMFQRLLYKTCSKHGEHEHKQLRCAVAFAKCQICLESPPLTPFHILFERFKHKLMFLFLSFAKLPANERFCRRKCCRIKNECTHHDETIRQWSFCAVGACGKLMTKTKL